MMAWAYFLYWTPHSSSAGHSRSRTAVPDSYGKFCAPNGRIAWRISSLLSNLSSLLAKLCVDKRQHAYYRLLKMIFAHDGVPHSTTRQWHSMIRLLLLLFALSSPALQSTEGSVNELVKDVHSNRVKHIL